MKIKNGFKMIAALALILLMVLATNIFAQRGRGFAPRNERSMKEREEREFREPGICRNLPGITQEQSDKMDAIRLQSMKENQQLRNQLGEKQAQLRTLKTAEQPDMNAINKTIDEMAALRAGMHKNQVAKHQEIRKLLTEEQRILFDSRGSGKRGYASICDGGPKGRGDGGPKGRGPGFRADCPYRK